MGLYKSKGLALYCQLDGSNYVQIGNISNLKLPEGEQQFEDVSVLMSTCVEDGEPVGVATPGEFGCDVFYDPTDAAHALFYAKTVVEDVSPVLNEVRKGATVLWRFTGTPKKLSPTAAVKSFMKANLAIKLKTPATMNP